MLEIVEKIQNINKLFTKFERLGIEKNTTTEGTGLGLAITKKLVELMHGTINVESRYKEGTIFMVQLPQKIDKLSRPLAKDIENTSEILTTNLDFHNKKILVVDDNKLNLKVARRTLSSLNIEMDEATSGNECLDKINSGNKYDAILMDIMMPGMNGEVTLRELKKIENFDTPVLAVTADAIQGAEEKYLNEGFYGYISKPFTKEEMKEKLAKVLKQDEIL